MKLTTNVHDKVLINRLALPGIGLLSLAVLGGALGAGCEGPSAAPETVEVTAQPLVGGTPTFVRPEIGQLVAGLACTATLVDTRLVITAAHCFNYATGPISGTFTMTTSFGNVTSPIAVDFAYSLGTSAGATDIALGRLTSAVDPFLAVPAVIGPKAFINDRVSAFGYGCTQRTGGGGGVKRFVDYTHGTTTIGCKGDSGGPRVHGFHDGNGSIWGITSAFEAFSDTDPNGTDLNGDAAQFGPPLLRAVRAFGRSSVTSGSASTFASWATAARAALSGDFNGDGFGDVALAGGAGWTSIPVAFGDGSGGFTVPPPAFLADFPGFARAARSIVAGDFDGDGRTDIALTGGSWWNTIPIAYSNGNGTFRTTNLQTPNLPEWSKSSIAVAGDFNGDGAGDIALLGGSGWNTIPVGFSNRNGTFTQTNNGVADFPGFARGAWPVVGDFDADGDADIALSGVSGWNTIPVALSDRLGGFTPKNNFVRDFPGWATLASLTAGDFDGDGDVDIAAAGGAGWNTVAFALSDRAGGFQPANLPLATFPGLASAARFIISNRADAGSTSDLMLLGGSGWTSIHTALLRP